MNFVSLNCRVCQPEGREKVLLIPVLEFVSADARMPMVGRRETTELLLCVRAPRPVTGQAALSHRHPLEGGLQHLKSKPQLSALAQMHCSVKLTPNSIF